LKKKKGIRRGRLNKKRKMGCWEIKRRKFPKKRGKCSGFTKKTVGKMQGPEKMKIKKVEGTLGNGLCLGKKKG